MEDFKKTVTWILVVMFLLLATPLNPLVLQPLVYLKPWGVDFQIWTPIAQGVRASGMKSCSAKLAYSVKLMETGNYVCNGNHDPNCTGGLGESGFYQFLPGTEEWLIDLYPELTRLDLYDLREATIMFCYYSENHMQIGKLQDETPETVTQKLYNLWNKDWNKMSEIANRAYQLSFFPK